MLYIYYKDFSFCNDDDNENDCDVKYVIVAMIIAFVTLRVLANRQKIIMKKCIPCNYINVLLIVLYLVLFLHCSAVQ